MGYNDDAKRLIDHGAEPARPPKLAEMASAAPPIRDTVPLWIVWRVDAERRIGALAEKFGWSSGSRTNDRLHPSSSSSAALPTQTTPSGAVSADPIKYTDAGLPYTPE